MVTLEIPEGLLWIFVVLLSADCVLSGIGIYYRHKLLKIEEGKHEV